MRLKTKLLLDRFIGRICCFLLIPCVYVLGLVLRRDHSIRDDNVRCIVVAKYLGLGSITQAGPMLRALKARFPAAKLVFVSRRGSRRLLSLMPDVDEVLLVDDENLYRLAVSNLELFRQLRKLKVDLFFDLEVFSAYGAMVSLFSLARNRLGFFCSKVTDFKAWIYTHLMYYNFQMPVRYCYLQLARMAGASPDASADLIPFSIPEEIALSTAARLNDIAPERGLGLIALNVNASDLSLARRWPAEKFAEVAAHFAAMGYQIILPGSPEERPYVQRVIDLMPDDGLKQRVHNVAGLFPFEEVLELLRLCDLFLTNDAGLMNLAFAQKVPTLGLYGPNTPTCVHVDDGVNVAIHKPVYCSPCLYHLNEPPCGGSAYCLDKITVEEVIAAMLSMLKGQKPANDQGQCPLPENTDALISRDGHRQYTFGALKSRL